MDKMCMYCKAFNISFVVENLQCNECLRYVHLKCLKKGIIPSGLTGDVFYVFTCFECSKGPELFIRYPMAWLQATLLSIHHMQNTNYEISRNGYFHWKIHIATFIDKHWEKIFEPGFQKQNNWIEDVLDTLFEHNMCCFKSGKELFGEKGWWTLMFPSLTPYVVMQLEIGSSFHGKEVQLSVDDKQVLKEELYVRSAHTAKISKRRNSNDDLDNGKKLKIDQNESTFNKLDNFSCHFNVVMRDLSKIPKLSMEQRLMGGVQADLIFSPYSNRFLPPYIYRFQKVNPSWLQLMEEIQLKVNCSSYKLPPRDPLDVVYVQREHIPAINSLCNQFFWSGIDVSDVLEYPEFSCVVLYRKLIVAFALLTPDININESYLSFIFTRPGWRNMGIGKMMLYHLTQVNTGRDITLHVSKNSKALLLYNKFCFKVEHIVMDFYDKYMRSDTSESKHAYFCRLTR